MAVKFGPDVTKAEADMQAYAWTHLDHNIIRVPKVYRFFSSAQQDGREIGYLVMEFIEGSSREAYHCNNIINRLVRAILQISEIPIPPGPIGGKQEPRGYLWGDDGASRAFASSLDIED
ncbi:MAG: hypothetical protein M1818_007609 [Claussenomyces sp. TS43310]|nr:MAG: hypothetical protein M1818_007609 [Claussenomyces sp. TS43310]